MTDASARPAIDLDFSGLAVRLEGLPVDLAAAVSREWSAQLAARSRAPFLHARVGPLGRAMTPGPEMVHGVASRFDAGGARFELDEGVVEVGASGEASIRLADGPAPRQVYAIVNLVLAGLAWRMADLPAGALHAAGIVLDGRAFVLVGPAGAGKSTFCRLAADAGAVVLSDDVTLVDASGEGVDALGAPFRHRPFPPPPAGRWPVAAVLLPRHGTVPALDPVSRLELEARLQANLLYAGAAADARAAAVVRALAAKVASRRLTFAPDGAFVETLRRLC